MASTKTVYKPKGTCSTEMAIEVEDGVIKDVKIKGGCEGNLKGMSRLVTGMETSEAIKRLEGIKCGNKGTSCPDQLTRALKKMES